MHLHTTETGTLLSTDAARSARSRRSFSAIGTSSCINENGNSHPIVRWPSALLIVPMASGSTRRLAASALRLPVNGYPPAYGQSVNRTYCGRTWLAGRFGQDISSEPNNSGARVIYLAFGISFQWRSEGPTDTFGR